MKKLTVILLMISFLFSLVSCSEKLKTEDNMTLDNCAIKLSVNNKSSTNYDITPKNFDLEKLEKKGYKMEINVSYDVYYKKDWQINLGYAGAPKYEVSIVSTNGMEKYDKSTSNSTERESKTLTFSANVSELKNAGLTLTFSTENIQNIIYFENIKVSYRCYE